jgi:aarF domain-containing kinase
MRIITTLVLVIQLATLVIVFPVHSYIISPNKQSNNKNTNTNNAFTFHPTQQQQQQKLDNQQLHQQARSTALFVATAPNTQSKTTTTTTSTSSSSLSSTVNDDSEVIVEFPPPLSTTDRIQRAATFWSTAIPIVLTYYGLMTRIKLQELLGSPYTPEEQIQQYKLLHTNGAYKLNETITNLKGFYVKTAQIVSTRKDLFPEEYTDALSGFTDNLDPMPVELAKAVVITELLNKNEKFDDVFIEFDTIPLGAASVAQVHRAVLSKKYGGPREVAVKIQRPSIESKLMGDIANLKAITKTFRGELPLDYYTVMCELEVQLQDEFDFIKEAVAMERIYNAVKFAPDGSQRDMPLVIPRPIPGLVSRRVLVQDYLHGVPLSRARDIMIKKGIDPDSPESKLFGRKLLTSLTEVFGRTILETGFFHAE